MLLVALLVAGGRLIRHHLLVGGDGRWRDPLFLDGLLPPVTDTARGGEDDSQPEFPLAIQSCTAQELTAVPGIGPVLAARIIAARQAGLQFARPADLEQVKGIGPKLSVRLAPYLRFIVQPSDSIIFTDKKADSLSQEPARLSPSS
jgi:competence protein ComEA